MCVIADDELSRVALEDRGAVLEDCANVVVGCAALDICTDVALDVGTDAALEDRGAVLEYCTEFDDAALEDRTIFVESLTV